MRTATTTLANAQKASKRTPYIKMVFTMPSAVTYDLSTDSATYGNRILGIDHHEAAYNDFAYITLQDYNRTIPDLRGGWVEIGYGDTTTGGNEYSSTPRLWVMGQETVYASNKAIVVLSLEGMWSLMKRKLALFVAPIYYDPSILYGNYTDTATGETYYSFGVNASLYTMMYFVIHDMAGLTLNAIGDCR